MKSKCTGGGVITEYEPGDRVRIRRDLKEGMVCPFGVNSDMEKLAGRVVTIKAARTVDSLSTGTFYLYNIYEDSGIHNWSQEMLEPYAQFSMGGVVALGNGEIVTVNDSERYMPIIDFNEAYKKMLLSCDTISLTLGNAIKNKSGIESRKDIRKRLLKL